MCTTTASVCCARDRTDDFLQVNQTSYQLSHTPSPGIQFLKEKMVDKGPRARVIFFFFTTFTVFVRLLSYEISVHSPG